MKQGNESTSDLLHKLLSGVMKPITISSQLLVAVLLAAFTLQSGCSIEGHDRPGSFMNADYSTGSGDLNVTVKEPVKRDFSEIKESGVLRVITRYSSNSYFLHQGLEWGFEYELVREFAKEHDLALEVVIVEPDESPYDLLNSGRGDLIAANYTITPERKQYVKFTRPYHIVDQVLVFSDMVVSPPRTLEELVEKKIPLTVRRNSSYYSRLAEIHEEGLEVPVEVVSDEKDTEYLLNEVARGDYLATVADEHIFQAISKYNNGLVRGPVIAENDSIAWAIRTNAGEMETQLNRFLYKHFRFGAPDEQPKRSAFLNILRKRYFEEGVQIAGYHDQENRISEVGLISPYDEMIRSVADSAGVDWLLIASMIAQETKFNPESESWAGAVGLMQVIPRFSEVESRELLFDAEINLREGVRIIKEHLDHYSYMDSTNQWAFALATYNAGMGHVADARRLAIDLNRDPNEWENTADALLKLMQRKYYSDARYGYARGIETVRYVKEIMNRYKTYESVLVMAEHNRKRNPPGMLGLFN